jgi:hypothetical protein
LVFIYQLGGIKLLEFFSEFGCIRKLLFRRLGQRVLNFAGASTDRAVNPACCTAAAALGAGAHVKNFAIDAGFAIHYPFAVAERAQIILGKLLDFRRWHWQARFRAQVAAGHGIYSPC